MTSGTEADIAALKTEFARLRDDVGKIAGSLQDLVRHGKAEVGAKARDSAEQLVEEVARRSRGVTDMIEEQPVAATLISFVVGMVLGALTSGRRS